MSGEATYRGPRPLELNEVSLNGDGDVKQIAPGKFEPKGGYFRKRILIGKPQDEKPEEINLGSTIKVVFLKIRRKLVERGDKGAIVRSTSEHTSKNDVVTLFDSKTGKRVVGVAADLREQYEGLRTVQIIYALLCAGPNEPELVRLIIKGASLGSEAKAENVMDFYRYLGSFRGDEHVWQYQTILSSVREEGAKSYYVIDFKRGDRLDDASQEFAIAKLKDVHAKCTEIDAARAAKIAKADVQVETAAEEGSAEGGEVEYPADEIDPDSIPF